MDNYPDHLAPEFDEGGGVATPFEEWWPRVKDAFPHVPDNVARYWLHEHWRYSPFDYLPSRNYRFEPQEWPSDRIIEILSRLSNFEPGSQQCLEHGHHLVENKQWDGKPYKTAAYMLEHGEWPQPIVVLDNRDGHLLPEKMDKPFLGAPVGYILIEGHRRFAIGLHLLKTGRMKPAAKL
jgi:hypothetical protein